MTTNVDDTTSRPGDLPEVAERLSRAEATRLQQLSSLPDRNLDPVAAAYRGSVERILDDIRSARRRLRDGLYGVCAACGTTISAERLELRPWATTCTRCAQRQRY